MEGGSIKLGYFNVQTTGFSPEMDEVIQISCMIGETNYSVYVKPTVIPNIVSNITGLTVDSNNLYHKGKEVETEFESSAWNGLLSFITRNSPVLLVGHNIVGFHARFMLKYLRRYNLLEESRNHIIGFADTLTLFKKERVEYALESLIDEYKIQNFEAYNGPSINEALKELLGKANIQYATIVKYQKTFSEFIQEQEALEEKKQNKNSLEFLKDYGVSNYMIDQLAEAKFNRDKLLKDRDDGTLTDSLQRVTKTKHIIERIVSSLDDL